MRHYKFIYLTITTIIFILILLFKHAVSTVIASVCEGTATCSWQTCSCRWNALQGYYCDCSTHSASGSCRFVNYYGSIMCGALICGANSSCIFTANSCTVWSGRVDLATNGCNIYHWGCSGTSCVKLSGHGSDTCSSSCRSQGWGSWSTCSNSCGNGSQSRTCNCSGDCCTGCDGYSCNSTQSQQCCVCNNSCNCNASKPDYRTQCQSPYCGQNVCHTTSGERCSGSSCAISCTKTDCGKCDDLRSARIEIENTNNNNISKTHDLPLFVSGHARDRNGITHGVEDVHIYVDCPSESTCNQSHFWTSFNVNSITIKPNDPNAGYFSGAIKASNMANLYNRIGRDGGNHSHALYFFAVQTQPPENLNATCGNWYFGKKEITLTNSSPQNQSLSLCQQNPEFCFCGSAVTGLSSCLNLPILSYTNNNILRIKAAFSDPDSFPSEEIGFIRESDIDEAYIIFDDDNNENNGYFYRIKYKDNPNNNSYTITEDGGRIANLVDINNHSRNVTHAYTLNLTIDLDFSKYPRENPFHSNIYVRARDFAGKESPKSLMISTTFTAAPYWYKLRNASLNKKGELRNYINNLPSPYDTDDTYEKLLIVGEAGPVLVQNSGQNTLGFTPIENYLSQKRFFKEGYNFSNQPRFFIPQYIAYAKSRKLINYIQNDISKIKPNMINIYQGSNLTLSQDINQQNIVLILMNNENNLIDLRIDKNVFNQSRFSQAFLARSITFSNSVTEANGIFLAFSFNLKDLDPQYITTPLKINGNLVSMEEIVDTTVRRRIDITKPSIFIVFNPKIYLDLLPYLSVYKYDWRQLQ